MDKTLHLVLKKKWFDMIISGAKKEEYREMKKYWANRLTIFPNDYNSNPDMISRNIMLLESYEGFAFKTFDTITFRLGYAKKAPTMVVECKGIRIGTPRPEWSGNMQGDHFIISLGAILKTQNISNG